MHTTSWLSLSVLSVWRLLLFSANCSRLKNLIGNSKELHLHITQLLKDDLLVIPFCKNVCFKAVGCCSLLRVNHRWRENRPRGNNTRKRPPPRSRPFVLFASAFITACCWSIIISLSFKIKSCIVAHYTSKQGKTPDSVWVTLSMYLPRLLILSLTM